jgi:hypothetical protein
VNAHLPAVEGVGTLTARTLADNQAEELGWHSDGAGDLEVLLKGLVLQLGADLLDSGDVARSQGDADAVDWGLLNRGGLNQ